MRQRYQLINRWMYRTEILFVVICLTKVPKKNTH